MMKGFHSIGDSRNGIPEESPLQSYLSLILKDKWIILISIVAVTALTGFFTFTADIVFESTSLVLIDPKGEEGSISFLDLTGVGSANKIANELEILSTRSMAEEVSRALLKKVYLDGPDSVMISIIRATADGEPQEKPTTVSEVTRRLMRLVDFVPIRDSDIIRITARSTNPKEAALVANTYTEAYARRNLRTSRLRTKSVREFLQTQLETKQKGLDEAETALQEYMRSSGMLSLDVEANKVVEQLSKLEADRDAMEVEISFLSQTLDSYLRELVSQQPNVAKAIGNPIDAHIRLLQQQLAKLEVQRNIVIAENPLLAGETMFSEKLMEIDAQISSLKKDLQLRTQDFLASLLPSEEAAGFLFEVKQRIIQGQIELEGLVARRKSLGLVISDYEERFAQIPEKSIELAKLQRARLSSEKLYLLVEEKFGEAAITEQSAFGYVDIIEPAITPSVPVSPKVNRNLVMGGLIGLGLGLAIIIFRARLDDRVHTPEELKTFGYVPLSAIRQMEWKLRKGREEQIRRVDGKVLDIHLVSFLNPFSSVAESYRRLRTSLQHAQVDKPLKCIMVTSANPKEGKSTTVANLAIAFSQTEKRVLLVDADMRRPVLHTLFCVRKDPGLTDLLFGESTFEQVVRERVLDNLDVICCGAIPPNPAEILGSRKMWEFLNQNGRSYDLVLFDTPPLLAVTDAAVLAKAVDGAILVVSAGSTRIAAVKRAVEFLPGIGGKLLGVVLNNFDRRKAYGGGYYGYGYGSYGYRYGYEYSNDSSNNGGKKRQHALT